MIVVTGAPRSGTSLMMRLLGNALGWDRVVGVKFPVPDPRESESRRQNYIQQYGLPGITPEIWSQMEQYTGETNPAGLWEIADWTVMGIPHNAPWFPKDAIIKLTGTALGMTDPARVDRVIYIVRDPRDQFHSATRRLRHFDLNVGEDSPYEWLKQNRHACDFLVKNKTPSMLIPLELLQKCPPFYIGLLADALPGNWDTDKHPIKSWSYTGEKDWPPGPLWDTARECYGWFMDPDSVTPGYPLSTYAEVAKKIEEVRNRQAINQLTPEERIMVGLDFAQGEPACQK